MRIILIVIFSLIAFSTFGYHENDTSFDEDEIICIATYELAEDFFLQMNDPST